MKINFLVLTILFTFQLTYAQDAFKVYKMESIYLEGGKFVKNDVKYPVGLFSHKLGKEMNVSPHAVAEWKQYKNFRNWGFVTSLVGLGLTLSSLTTDNQELQTGLLLSGLTMSIVSIPLSIKANNQLQKAVWTRNRDILQF